MFKLVSFFVKNANSNDWIWPQWYHLDKKKEVTYIDTLLIYTLWYDFSNDFDAQSDFGKYFSQKKLASWNILLFKSKL